MFDIHFEPTPQEAGGDEEQGTEAQAQIQQHGEEARSEEHSLEDLSSSPALSVAMRRAKGMAAENNDNQNKQTNMSLSMQQAKGINVPTTTAEADTDNGGNGSSRINQPSSSSNEKQGWLERPDVAAQLAATSRQANNDNNDNGTCAHRQQECMFIWPVFVSLMLSCAFFKNSKQKLI